MNIKNPKILDFEGQNWNGTGVKAEYYDLLDNGWLPVKDGYFATEVDAIKYARNAGIVVGNLDSSNWRITEVGVGKTTN